MFSPTIMHDLADIPNMSDLDLVNNYHATIWRSSRAASVELIAFEGALRAEILSRLEKKS